MVYDYRRILKNVRYPLDTALTIDPTASGAGTALDVEGFYDLKVYIIRAAGGAGDLVVNVEVSRDGTNYTNMQTLTLTAGSNFATTVDISSALYLRLNVTTEQALSVATSFVMGQAHGGSPEFE